MENGRLEDFVDGFRQFMDGRLQSLLGVVCRCYDDDAPLVNHRVQKKVNRWYCILTQRSECQVRGSRRNFREQKIGSSTKKSSFPAGGFAGD